MTAPAASSRPRITAVAGIGLLLMSATHCTSPATGHDQGAPGAVVESRAGRMYPGYSPASVWNQPIPSDAEVDPASAALVGSLVRAHDHRGFVIAVSGWTVPVYFADGETPRVDVVLTGRPPGAHNDPDFPMNVRSILADVPIPEGAKPDPEADAHLTVVDHGSGCEFDLYGARKVGDQWIAEWGNGIPLHSDGIYPHGLSTRGSGFAPLAGMITPDELAAGEIPHALVFSYPTTRAGGPVAPATASDGKTHSPSALPIGARLQLDPTLDLATLGLTDYELVIARALQRFGMILGDTGGAVTLFAVNSQSVPTPGYTGLLPDEPYPRLDNIPVERFRVLRLPPQRAVTPLRTEPGPCARHVGR